MKINEVVNYSLYIVNNIDNNSKNDEIYFM